MTLIARILSILTLSCSTTLSEGQINYLIQLDSAINFDNKGLTVTYTNLDTIRNTLDMSIDFHFSKKALKQMAGHFHADTTLGQLPDYSAEIHGQTLELQDIKLTWNKDWPRSFITAGQIPVLAINNETVGKYLNGYLELQIKKSGNQLHIYLHDNSDNWYFFSFIRGYMYTLSSNDEFNSIIERTSVKKKRLRAKKGELGYFYLLTNRLKMSRYLRYMKE